MNFWPKGKHLMKKVALLIVFMENEIKVGMKKKNHTGVVLVLSPTEGLIRAVVWHS